MADPIQAQVAAYNARDLDAFVACFADDVVVTDGAGKPIMTGVDDLRKSYAAMFAAHPDLHAEIVSRVHAGDWTVDLERVSRSGTTMEVLVAYLVGDDLIRRGIMFR
jgi:uncharacterized protein (TIGR02246 family)